MPSHIARFYEELIDLENETEFSLERSPALSVDWGNNVLSDQVLNNVAGCFHFIPGSNDTDRHVPFDHYLTGLGFLGKTDVFMQFIPNAFEHFYRAFRETARCYGTWDGNGSFVEPFAELLGGFMSNEADREGLVVAGACIEAGKPAELSVDLSDAARMKLLADALIMKQFRDELASAAAPADI